MACEGSLDGSYHDNRKSLSDWHFKTYQILKAADNEQSYCKVCKVSHFCTKSFKNFQNYLPSPGLGFCLSNRMHEEASLPEVREQMINNKTIRPGYWGKAKSSSDSPPRFPLNSRWEL